LEGRIATTIATGDDPNTVSELARFMSLVGLSPPTFVITHSGPDHAVQFTAELQVNGHTLVRYGPSKKNNTMECARTALAHLRAGAQDNHRGTG
jgi:dsRNA-specific ribonuclease